MEFLAAGGKALDPESYCTAGLEYRMWVLSVDGATKREMTDSVAEPFQVIQLTEDTAYAMMKECVKGTDGKWSSQLSVLESPLAPSLCFARGKRWASQAQYQPTTVFAGCMAVLW